MIYVDEADEWKLTNALSEAGLDSVCEVSSNAGSMRVTVPGADLHVLMDELDFRGIDYTIK